MLLYEKNIYCSFFNINPSVIWLNPENLTFRYYYEHEDKMLDKALIYAKENRNELKKILKYYKNDKADTPNTLQPVNGMNDFLFASQFYKIAADSSYFRKNTRKH